MNLQRSREHAKTLRAFAEETKERAAAEPDNFLLGLIAKNQLDAAEDQELKLCLAEGKAASESLEWRLIGQTTKNGEVPLALLGKLADPLNKLLLRAAYFARTGEELARTAAESFSREMNLKLAGLAEGSARLLIVGNTMPDTTGSAPLVEGIDHLLDAFQESGGAVTFYESLANLGEQATHSLHDVLKAIEQEECSIEITRHSADKPRSEILRHDQVVKLRNMLSGSSSPEDENSEVSGLVALLSSRGRIQVTTLTGEKINVRFRPKADGAWVEDLRLGQAVTLKTKAKVFRDPSSGEETRVHRLAVN